MKSKLLLIISFLFIFSTTFSQQIGDGAAPIISDFSVPLLSGVYNGLNAAGAPSDNSYGGWQHLFVIRHSNLSNNHQLQLSSSFANTDRLFFRKIATGLNSSNSNWFELATRGVNVFEGNQIVNGKLSIFTNYAMLSVSGQSGLSSILLGNRDSAGVNNPAVIYAANGALYFGGGNNWDTGGDLTASMSVSDNGNVGIGIGTQSPSGKLDVMGPYTDVSLDANSPASANFRTPGHVQLAISSALNFPYTTSLQSKHATFNGNSYPIALNPLGGNVGIGTTDPKNKLSVNGTIWAKEVKVSLTDAADWVFDKNYKLKPLAEVEKYINDNKHLPEVPSAEEFRQNDMNVSQMSNKLLQKVEELTLYIISQNKDIEELKAQVNTLKSQKQ